MKKITLTHLTKGTVSIPTAADDFGKEGKCYKLGLPPGQLCCFHFLPMSDTGHFWSPACTRAAMASLTSSEAYRCLDCLTLHRC